MTSPLSNSSLASAQYNYGKEMTNDLINMQILGIDFPCTYKIYIYLYYISSMPGANDIGW